MSALYENDALLQLTGGALHPGGEAVTRRALALAALLPGARVLDIGCGTGGAVRMLRAQGMEATGIDASAKLVTLADSPFVTQGDGRCIAGVYDALLLECVLSLLGDRTAFLRTAKEALVPRGRLILCEPYRRGNAGVALPVKSCVNGVPDEAGVREQMAQAGFACIAWRDETDALRSFLAMLVMAFGSADAFLCDIAGGCARVPEGMRLGYAASVWEKMI